MRGDIRGTAVPGAMPGVQPCSGLLRDLPMCWTVGISPRGEGPTGRGNLFPLPCLPHSNHLTSAGTPTPPAPAALLPRPLPQEGVSARAYTWGAAVPGVEPVSSRARFFAGLFPDTGPCGYRHGGWRPAGRGNSFPLPCLSRSRHLAPCQPYPARPSAGRLPIHPAGTPTPSLTGISNYQGQVAKREGCRRVPPGCFAGNGAGYDVCCFPKVERLDWCVPAT